MLRTKTNFNGYIHKCVEKFRQRVWRNYCGLCFIVALLTAVFDWNNVLAAYLRAKSRCQHCRSHSSLQQYLFNFECIRLFLFYSVIFQSCKFQSCKFSYPKNAQSPAFRQPSTTCSTSLPAQHLRPSGLFSCRPQSLELSPGFHPGPDHQDRLFQTFA